jgi:predicted dehydrogenase
MARLRVGVIGCGTVAQIMWLPNLRELDEHFELAAICDLSPALLQSLGDYYGVERRFLDYRDLVAEQLDAVIVLTPGSHAPQAIAALEAGKHVIVEKPMCFTLHEADAMIAAAAGAGARHAGGVAIRICVEAPEPSGQKMAHDTMHAARVEEQFERMIA